MRNLLNVGVKKKEHNENEIQCQLHIMFNNENEGMDGCN
jgi:hypothetical protein